MMSSRAGQAIGAVDIGGTKIAVAAVDARGNLLAKEETATAAKQGFESAMGRVAAMLERVSQSASVALSGIGIACTGPVNPLTGEIGNVEFLPGWQGCNPVKELARHFSLEAAMENDADAAALAEVHWGAGRGKRSVISVTVGTGIGGGIFLNGALYRGVDGAHPEIGHHVIDATGPLCGCGARGCWEILASGPAMAKRFRAVGVDTAQTICEKARIGDPAALAAVETEAGYLGVGLANLVTLFAPETLVLSGSVMESADLFLPRIREVIGRHCGLVPSHRVALSRSALGRDAPLIGASVVWKTRGREVRASC